MILKSLSSINYIVWLILSVLATLYGDYLSKKFALSPSWRYVVIITIVYSVGTILWLPAILQENELSVVGTMWAVMLYIGIAFVGLFIFKESINIYGVLGIILGLASIVLLTLA
jgi:multidrug transporter EmrE-like cation transporter